MTEHVPGQAKPCPSPAVVLGPASLSVDLLETYITRDELTQVVMLLRDGPTCWERRYRPLPGKADHIAEVVVRCTGELCEVLLNTSNSIAI